ncbi:unnamed protein product [marine sediment metagenome]|uniref:Uncharacterized protein n=1 Tax=marine sediment metagenome TaxID=412755 RepID=X1A4F4_9ZZZZ
MISKDLIFDDNNDLKIVDGDFAIEQSDDQNIETIFKAEKGQFYNFLTIDYGVYRRIFGPFRKNQERKDIREELKKDEYNTVQLDINDDFEIFVDANKIK